MKRIFLIGYMGTGKTTAGRELARVLQLQFIDLDHYIQSRYLKSVGELFTERGEDGFREIERAMLHEVGEIEDVVVATGGGTPCFFDNMHYMNLQGTTIYLQASPQALTKRLYPCRSGRPLIKDKTEQELLQFVIDNLAKRSPIYEQAHILFATEGFAHRDEVGKYVEKLMTQL